MNHKTFHRIDHQPARTIPAKVTLSDLMDLSVDKKAWTQKEAARQRWDSNKIGSCTGKVVHQTERHAKIHARITKHGKSYKCRYCGLWHIGSRS